MDPALAGDEGRQIRDLGGSSCRIWEAPPVGYGSSAPDPAVAGSGRAQRLEDAGDKRRRSSAPSTWTAATPPKTSPTAGALLLRMYGGVSGVAMLLEVTGVTAAVYGSDHKLFGACHVVYKHIVITVKWMMVLRHMAPELSLGMRSDRYVRVLDLLGLNLQTFAKVHLKSHTMDEIREAVRRDSKQLCFLLSALLSTELVSVSKSILQNLRLDTEFESMGACNEYWEFWDYYMVLWIYFVIRVTDMWSSLSGKDATIVI
uniref:2'-phosphotransferase n=1 Tax=Aegilops tauschii TaxID=37682 RepID=M8B9U6_AEGTA